MAWFNWGADDIGAELRAIRTEQAQQRAMLVSIINSQGVIMALVSIEQSVLDELGNTLGTIADGVQVIIDDPSNDLGPADFTAVTAGVARLQSLVAAPETPADETPVEPAPDA